jgi:hypothetical protein
LRCRHDIDPFHPEMSAALSSMAAAASRVPA